MSTVYESVKLKLDELMMGETEFQRYEEHNAYFTTVVYRHHGSRQGLGIRYVPNPRADTPELRGTSVIGGIVRENAESLNVDEYGRNMTLFRGNEEVIVPLKCQLDSDCKKFSYIYALPQEDLDVYELIFNYMIAAMRNGLE